MHHSEPVGVLECCRDLQTQPQDFRLGKAVTRHPIGQRRSGDVLHHQEVHAALRIEVVNGRNVLMIQTGERERFAAQTSLGGIAGESAGPKYFERDVAIEALVVGAKDDTHPTFANFLEDAIVSECLANHGDARMLQRNRLTLTTLDRRAHRRTAVDSPFVNDHSWN